ncbi:MAG: TIGR03747 family integrating conjugative element membrane protein [Thiotrichaceae bacterium]|nr:MAG: TIGR03747 family integrating conjugative element membrane protein [Thiotrichaceae bacterium]
MAETTTVARNDHPVKKRGVISKTFDNIFKVFGLLIFSALISIIIEWIGMTFYYPDEGYQHAQNMLEREIGYLGNALESDRLNGDAIETAGDYVNDTVSFLFIDSGLLDALVSAKTPTAGDSTIMRYAKLVVGEYYDYLISAMFIMTMFFVRLSILILSMPAFLLFGIVGLSDGLMQRDLRRWCGGNESGYIYHWAKRFALPVLVITWVIYLAIPSSIHPNFIITPFAVMFGLVLMVMSSKFKKYL